MHRIPSFLTVAALLAASVAHAQGSISLTRPISIGISGGVAVPSGELSNGASSGFSGTNTGYNITGSVAFAAPVLPFSVRLDGSYDKFGTRNVIFPAVTAVNCPCTLPLGSGGYNADVRVIAFTANVVYSLPLPTAVIRPYLIGGGGVFNVVQEPFGSGNYSQTNAGYDLGAGATVPMGAFNAFVEARYNRVNQHSGSVAFIPVTFGVMF